MAQNLTYRVDFIPNNTNKTALKNLFHTEDRQYIEIKSLVPDIDNYDGTGTLTATLLFKAPHENPPRPDHEDLKVDKDFGGFTPLNEVDGEVAADIIALTGLAGHAFGTWACTAEKMWLRDFLPKKLGDKARILIYGYKSRVSGPDVGKSIISDFSNVFWDHLMTMRRHPSCANRPLILIGHSLGGLIIKQCIVEEDPVVLSRHHLRAIFFFGTPHGGLNIEALQEVVKGQPNQILVSELQRNSPTLSFLAPKFIRRVSEAKVQICSYYESIPTKTTVKRHDGTLVREGPAQIMVDTESARLNYGRLIQIDGDHRTMVKLTNSRDGQFPSLVASIQDCLQSGAEMHDARRQVGLAKPRYETYLTLNQSRSRRESGSSPESPWDRANTPDFDDDSENRHRSMSDLRSSPTPSAYGLYEHRHRPSLVHESRSLDGQSRNIVQDTTFGDPRMEKYEHHSTESQSRPRLSSLPNSRSGNSNRDGNMEQSVSRPAIQVHASEDNATSSTRRAHPNSASQPESDPAYLATQKPSRSSHGSGIGHDNVGDGCGICSKPISIYDLYYRCPFCKDEGGNSFSVCADCENTHEYCPEGHDLVKRRPGAKLNVCETCGRRISGEEVYYYCSICKAGEYHVCKDCEDDGKTCPPDHDLLKKRPGSQNAKKMPVSADQRSVSAEPRPRLPPRSDQGGGRTDVTSENKEDFEHASIAGRLQNAQDQKAEWMASKPLPRSTGVAAPTPEEYKRNMPELPSKPSQTVRVSEDEPEIPKQSPRVVATVEHKAHTQVPQTQAGENIETGSSTATLAGSDGTGGEEVDLDEVHLTEVTCTCDGCGEELANDKPFFICLSCVDFDLCKNCFSSTRGLVKRHSLQHPCIPVSKVTFIDRPPFNTISATIQPEMLDNGRQNIWYRPDQRAWWTLFGPDPGHTRFLMEGFPPGTYNITLSLNFQVPMQQLSLDALHEVLRAHSTLVVSCGPPRSKHLFVNCDLRGADLNAKNTLLFSSSDYNDFKWELNAYEDDAGYYYQKLDFRAPSIQIGDEGLFGVCLDWEDMPFLDEGERKIPVLRGAIAGIYLHSLLLPDVAPVSSEQYQQYLYKDAIVNILAGGLLATLSR